MAILHNTPATRIYKAIQDDDEDATLEDHLEALDEEFLPGDHAETLKGLIRDRKMGMEFPPGAPPVHEDPSQYLAVLSQMNDLLPDGESFNDAALTRIAFKGLAPSLKMAVSLNGQPNTMAELKQRIKYKMEVSGGHIAPTPEEIAAHTSGRYKPAPSTILPPRGAPHFPALATTTIGGIPTPMEYGRPPVDFYSSYLTPTYNSSRHPCHLR